MPENRKKCFDGVLIVWKSLFMCKSFFQRLWVACPNSYEALEIRFLSFRQKKFILELLKTKFYRKFLFFVLSWFKSVRNIKTNYFLNLFLHLCIVLGIKIAVFFWITVLLNPYYQVSLKSKCWIINSILKL